MKFILNFIFLSLLGILIFPEIFAALSFGITLSIALQIFLKSNVSFMFREWTLFLYSFNYLLSPAITYQLNSSQVFYLMKISSDEYFSLAFPGFICFILGMYSIKNRLFSINFKNVNQSTLINEKYIIIATIFGVLLRAFSGFIPGEIGFFVYLVSLIRFVGAFSLFALNSKKFWWLVMLVLLFEIYVGFKVGMYHDSIMWLIFFSLFYLYTIKPSLKLKIVGGFVLIIFVLFIQAIKSSYREQVWFGGKEANIETITNIGATKANSNVLIGEENLLATLNRGNQAWIFASTVERMDRYKDFQGLSNVNKYLEAAILPRFLSPDKISSGDKKIFNQFSGHEINEGTSMGLGIYADGYIAFGSLGVYVFGFVLGLIFSLTFKIVESWTKISPFYALLLLPILNYAVRPDCELQTTINHLTKSIVVFGALVYFTRNRFTLESKDNQRKLLHLNLMK